MWIERVVEGLVVLAIAGAGLAHATGAMRVREHAFRAAMLGLVVLLVVPFARCLAMRVSLGSARVSADGLFVLAVIGFGHLALGIALLRRRLRGATRERDLERARTRRRERLRPPPEEEPR